MEGKLMNIPNICPRCKDNWIPCNERPGEYPGALSRADNETEICSACGEDEALKDFFDGGCETTDAWPVVRAYNLTPVHKVIPKD
jgi:hypothetical protein